MVRKEPKQTSLDWGWVVLAVIVLLTIIVEVGYE